MKLASLKTTFSAAYRQYARVLAFAVVLIVMMLCVQYFFVYQNRNYREPLTTSPQATSTAYLRSAPTHLRIPALSIDTSFVAPLGLNEDNTVSVPDSFTQVGWYKNGATPGEIGPAVILGHVDSVKGPAVFYSLGQLKVGDTIEITRADASVALFAVEKLERYPQDQFPTQLVYGQTDFVALRLVTCSGTFNKGAQRYSHNLVVFARLIE